MSRILALLALPLLAGCTTLQPLPDAQPDTIRQSIRPGDRVEVVLTDGTQHKLTVHEISGETLRGRGEGVTRDIPLSSIRSIGTRKMTTQDKVWTGVGIAAAVGAVVAIVAGNDDDGGSGGGGY